MPREQDEIDVTKQLVEIVRSTKESVQSRVDFDSNATARETFVVLLTLEGALMFGDGAELAQLCVEFCKKKEMDLVWNN